MGMNDAGGPGPTGQPDRWTLNEEHVHGLSAWIEDGASVLGIEPEHAADSSCERSPKTAFSSGSTPASKR